jgi:ABC-2 type transport system ATP-binding protein
VNAIEVESLSRHFGSFRAVDQVSFEVARGEIFGYLGANGAGKSTTIRMLCGLLTPSSGDARVAGHSIRHTPDAVKTAIGYMSQKFSLYLDLTVEDNLRFFGGAYGGSGRALAARIDEMLERTDLSAFRREVTGGLPGGIRQRVALASSLLHGPKIVFLDEPTAGVDPTARRAFWRLIRGLADAGTTVFVTTHYMDEAEYCARIGLMVGGRLVALDTPAALKAAWVPGRMFSVRLAGPRIAQAMAGRKGVLGIEPFGLAYHVRLAPGVDPRSFFGATEAAEPAEPVEPTLEDVFLAAVATPTPSPARPALPAKG